MWLLFLKRKEPSVGEDLKKTKPYTLLVGSELAQLLWKTVWRSLRKAKQNYLPYDPVPGNEINVRELLQYSP